MILIKEFSQGSKELEALLSEQLQQLPPPQQNGGSSPTTQNRDQEPARQNRTLVEQAEVNSPTACCVRHQHDSDRYGSYRNIGPFMQVKTCLV